MSTSYRPYAPDQALLLPPTLQEWLPEGHLAYFISDAVDALDLAAFHQRYAGDGRRRQPYDPAMMVKVLVYAYASGVFSSRKIARRLYEDVAFRVLAAGNFPSHRTLREFRRLHLGAFSTLFVRVVQLAGESGLVQLGHVAIDGTKVRASASKHKAMSYARMVEQEERLQAEVEQLTHRAERIDVTEDARYGADCSGEELPAELARREQRLATIRAAKARLEARQRALDAAAGRSVDDEGHTRGPGGGTCRRTFGAVPDKAQENFTDSDSRIMKSGGGFAQCYNAQAAVDASHQLIVATEVGQNANDQQRLIPMVEAVRANTGALPRMTSADAGYASEANLAALEERGAAACVSLAGRHGKVPERDPEQHPATHRMAQHLQSAEGKAHYRRRKCIVEPVFGWIKQAMGFRTFSMRGLAKVRGEWHLVCLAANLRRLHRVGWAP